MLIVRCPLQPTVRLRPFGIVARLAVALSVAGSLLGACETAPRDPGLSSRWTAAPGDASATPGDGPRAPSCEAFAGLVVQVPDDYEAVCGPVDDATLADELLMWELINEDRADRPDESNGAAPVTYDCQLAASARLHSYAMCKRAELEHELDGLDVSDRLERDLNATLGEDIATVGENIAWYGDVVSAQTGFVEEEPVCDPEEGGHRLNILDRDFRSVGVGVCRCEADPYGNLYLTQVFATWSAEASGLRGDNPFCGW